MSGLTWHRRSSFLVDENGTESGGVDAHISVTASVDASGYENVSQLLDPHSVGRVLGERFRSPACCCRCGSGLGRFWSLCPPPLVWFPFRGVQLLKKKEHRPQNQQWSVTTSGISPYSMFRDFGSLHRKHHVGGPPGCVRRDGSYGWRSPVPEATTGGRSRVLPSPTITLQSRRQVLYFLMHLGVDCVRDGRLSTSRRVPFLGLVLGLRFAQPEALRRHFLRAVVAAVFFVQVVSATSAWCRGTSQRNIAFQMFLQLRR